jgi:hypothetical protein
MKSLSVVAIGLAAACQISEPRPAGSGFPPEDPGVVIAAPSHAGGDWTPAWNPVTGQLVFAAHTGQYLNGSLLYPLSFRISSLDPGAPAMVTTLATQTDGGGFRALRIAETTGDVFYQFYPGHSTPNASLAIRRVSASGGNPVEVPTIPPLKDGFFVSSDGSRLLAGISQSNSQTLTSSATGQVLGTVNAAFPRSLSPDANQLLMGWISDTVVTLSTSIARKVVWMANTRQSVLAAAWKGASVRLLVLEETLVADKVRFTLLEWDESTGTSQSLGSVQSGDQAARAVCAGWSPSTHSAVLVSDTLVRFSGFDEFQTHRTIMAVAGGVATKLGSHTNPGTDFTTVPSCALSPDGKWFGYRVTPASIYLKRVAP